MNLSDPNEVEVSKLLYCYSSILMNVAYFYFVSNQYIQFEKHLNENDFNSLVFTFSLFSFSPTSL